MEVMGGRPYPKPAIFAGCRLLGMVFERKEHLGVGAAMLAWPGSPFIWARDDDLPGVDVSGGSPNRGGRPRQALLLVSALRQRMVNVV